MSVELKLTRVEHPHDPERCHRIVRNGSCPYKAIPNSKYCQLHGGNRQAEQNLDNDIKSIYRTKWNARILEFAHDPNVKTLREEIGILRMLIEGILDKCKTSHDILMYSAKISDLVLKVQKTVESTHRIENQLGRTLDKQAAINLAEQIITIINVHISDPDVMESIAQNIADAILNTAPMKELV